MSGDHHRGGKQGQLVSSTASGWSCGEVCLGHCSQQSWIAWQEGTVLVVWVVCEYHKEPTLHLQVPDALKAILAVFGLNCLDYLVFQCICRQVAVIWPHFQDSLCWGAAQSWLVGDHFGDKVAYHDVTVKGKSGPLTINCGTVEWGDRWKAQINLVGANVQDVGVGTLRHFQPFQESITHGLQWPLYEGAREIVQLQFPCTSGWHCPSVNSYYLNHSVEHHQSSS